jgi:beta-aspartyl-dipeptidase (metallo-type)
LHDVLEFSNGDIPISQFLPTHVNRSSELIEEAVAWVQDGGWADVTCSEDSRRTVHDIFNSFGIPCDRLTVSTDAYGSLPVFDEHGKLCRYTYAKPDTLLRFLQAAHLGTALDDPRFPLDDVLPLMTSNPASLLGLTRKGRLTPGADADVLLLDEFTLSLQYVFSLGEMALTPEWVRGSMFEEGPGIRPRLPS